MITTLVAFVIVILAFVFFFFSKCVRLVRIMLVRRKLKKMKSEGALEGFFLLLEKSREHYEFYYDDILSSNFQEESEDYLFFLENALCYVRGEVGMRIIENRIKKAKAKAEAKAEAKVEKFIPNFRRNRPLCIP